jgi:adenylate cyclase
MKKYIKYLLLALLIIAAAPTYAQLHGQARLDSLLKELPHQAEDTNKVKLLYRTSHEYVHRSPDEGIRYGQQALTLATKLGWKAGIAKSNTAIGDCHFYISDYPNALEYYEKALKLEKESGNKLGIAVVTMIIGNVYLRQANYLKALEYYLKATTIYKEIGDDGGIAGTNCNIGLVYHAQGDYVKALSYFFKALKYYEDTKNEREGAGVTNNIGSIFYAQDNYPEALVYYTKALKLSVAAENKLGEASALMSIGNIYNEGIKDYPKALEYYFKSMKIANEIGSKRTLMLAIGNIGGVYEDQQNYVQAAIFCDKALTLSKEIGAKEDEAYYLGKIGNLYLSIISNPNPGIMHDQSNVYGTSNYSELPEKGFGKITPIPQGNAALLSAALDYLQQSLLMCRELESPDVTQEVYKSLIKAYTLRGDYRKALDASDSFYAIKDALFSQENKEELLKMSMKNEYDRQRLTDSLRMAEKQKIAAINLQKQKNYTYLGVAGILLLAGFSFFIVKERGKSEKARKQSDELLLNILPEEVADELKTTGTTIAKHYDNVTVLFTDFVNFTQAGENMSPQNLIDELHSCFKAFDEISDKYNIEKIKTIGDAYLAVAGLPTADPKHAENVIKAAKEITAFMEDRLGKMGTERTFQVRVGIHSGSVVAGIVGVKKFAYDIWGDTVNTAARMEQNSEGGKINISQTTYELIKDKFTCEYRGEVEAKGKGVMKMYYVF